MTNQDIRWQQRFNSYKKALANLESAILKVKKEGESLTKDKFLNEILKEGIIQRFEYTHELAWNVMKDFLVDAGNANIYGSKDATREAFSAGLIMNG